VVRGCPDDVLSRFGGLCLWIIYYVWLVLPFIQKIELLQAGKSRPRRSRADDLAPGIAVRECSNFISSPFVWPAHNEAWSSSRLSKILKRETGVLFKAPLTISTYRHIAIAISRRLLEKRGSKRDYDIKENASDEQTTHIAWTAGRLYARGLEKVPEHIKLRRAEFRAISRHWHSFIGFTVPIARKRPLEDITNVGTPRRQRQRIEKDL
jgi:hypothetical protein